MRVIDRTDGTLAGGVVLTGLLAGLYYAYACSVMPALRHADDQTFVTIMQEVNDVILNPAFFLSFVGAPAATVVGAVSLHRRGDRRATRWALAALGAHAAGFLITAAVNVPLNDSLARDADRGAFETPWTIANDARALATTAALACVTLAVASRRRGA